MEFGLSAITDLDILLDGIEYSGSNIVLNEDEETTGCYHCRQRRVME